MITTIDAAGRVVIPKRLRDSIGLQAGEIQVTVDGAALRIEPVGNDEVVMEGGRLVQPKTSAIINDEVVRSLMDEGRR